MQKLFVLLCNKNMRRYALIFVFFSDQSGDKISILNDADFAIFCELKIDVLLADFPPKSFPERNAAKLCDKCKEKIVAD